MTTTQEWLTVEEAAQYLRVSKRTIYKLTEDGRLRAFRIGKERHRRFRRDDLDAVPQQIGRKTPAEKRNYLTAESDPVLAELWDNPEDAKYDDL